jgi:hypothetical protein
LRVSISRLLVVRNFFEEFLKVADERADESPVRTVRTALVGHRRLINRMIGIAVVLGSVGVSPPTAAGGPQRIDGPATPFSAASPTITTVEFTNVSTNRRDGAAMLTFGQAFARGDVPAGADLAAVDHTGASIPVQVDVKATHPDGSVRHAVITISWTSADAAGSVDLRLGASTVGPNVSAAQLLASGFDSVVTLNVGGTTYTSSARELLAADSSNKWLDGPLVTEFIVDGPLRTSARTEHSHLTARYNIRVQAGEPIARADVIVENTKMLLGGGSQDFDYDAQIRIGDNVLVEQSDITHYYSARWRRTGWWGAPSDADIAHDTEYLIASRAVPNYDQGFDIDPAAIAADVAAFETEIGDQSELPRDGIMGSGLITEYMPATGGRADLAPLPRWAARYLLSMDSDAKAVTIGTGNQAGSFSIHYRDPATDRPISAENHPDITTHSNFTGRPTWLGCALCPSVYDVSSRYTSPDTAHQPSMAYLPYLVTGDHYFLEEMQFWTGWNPLGTDPSYRQREKGLVDWQQIRARAWSLRELSRVAYITPDDDPMKGTWTRQLVANIEYFNARYVTGSETNALGAITESSYNDGTGIAPWQNDYLTATFGQIVELGFAAAEPMRSWLARFPTDRMTGSGACWILASSYTLNVRAIRDGPVFGSIAEVYSASIEPAVRDLPCAGPEMAAALGLEVGEMVGYSTSPQGYPAITQIALASAVDSGIPNAARAWSIFESRANKADYGSVGPELAIIPRPPDRASGGYARADRLPT